MLDTAEAVEVTQTKCVVFCVGIENYDDPGLNRLEYTAEDAYAVWKKLHLVAAVDTARSTLLVADRVPKGDLPPEPEHRVPKLGRDRLLTEFDDFLSRVQPGDIVVIYLGGHGLLKQSAKSLGVMFCASDSLDKEGNIKKPVWMSGLLTSIKGTPKDTTDVKVVFLANMCHAGAAQPRMGGSFDQDRFRSSSEADRKSLQGMSLAYLPACSGTLETTEDSRLGGSPFAVRLIEALEGAGSSGDARELTTGSVLRYLQDKIRPDPPPQVAPFDENIVVGSLLGQEAEVRRAFGMGLMACAFDEPDDRGQPIINLAARHFNRCLEIQLKGRLENLFALAQCQRDLGAIESPTIDRIIKAADGIQGQPGTEYEKAAVAMRDLSGTRPDERPFTALIFSFLPGSLKDMDQSSLKARLDYYSEDAAGWEKSLKARSGCIAVDVIPPIPFTNGEDSARAAETLVNVKKVIAHSDLAAAQEVRDLVLVYQGPARSITSEHTEVPYPFQINSLWDLARAWRGRTILVWAANAGGVLGAIPKDLEDKVALFLLAGQVNGELFGDHVHILSEAVRDGLTETSWNGLEAKIGERLKRPENRSENESLRQYFKDNRSEWGRPAWIGKFRPSALWGESRSRAAIAKIGLLGAPSPWWAPEFSVGSTADGMGRPRAEPPLDRMSQASPPWSGRIKELKKQNQADPYVNLELGALAEALGDDDAAGRYYEAFIKAVQSQIEQSGNSYGSELEAMRASSRKQLSEFTKRIKSRLDRDRNPSTIKRIHLVTVAVDDYVSTWIGDLAGSSKDATAWETALQKYFKGQIVPHPPKQPTAEEAIKALEEAVAKCGQGGIVVFVFSGRGFQKGGARFLATADSVPQGGTGMGMPRTFAEVGNPQASIISVSPALAVQDIAQKLVDAKVNAVVILDCQFTEPTRGLPPAKHLTSIIPPLTGSETKIPTSPGVVPEQGYLAIDPPRAADASGSLDNVIFIWWSGELVEQPAVGNVSSWLSRSLLKALDDSREGTYHDWVERAGKEILAEQVATTAPGPLTTAPGPLTAGLVIQGRNRRPLFWSGTDVRSLELLLAGYARRKTNLDMAIEIGEKKAGLLGRSADRLSMAALLFARSELIRSMGDYQAVEQSDKDLDACLRQLHTLAIDEPSRLQQEGLIDLFLPICARAYLRADKADEGRESLLSLLEKLGPSVLTIEFERRLVEMTKASAAQDADRKVKTAVSRVSASALSPDQRRDLELQLNQLIKGGEGPPDSRPIVPVPPSATAKTKAGP